MNDKETLDQIKDLLAQNEYDIQFNQKFRDDLSDLLNRHGIDTVLNTPDFILAEMLQRSLVDHFKTQKAIEQYNKPSYNYYLTFGVCYMNEIHPLYSKANPQGWVRIVAQSRDQAKELADKKIKDYAMIYSDDHFSAFSFPEGEIEVMYA